MNAITFDELKALREHIARGEINTKIILDVLELMELLMRGRGLVGCTCDEIMAEDVTRHFRGCPLREKYPTHEAENCGGYYRYVAVDGGGRALQCDKCRMWSLAGAQDGDRHNGRPGVRERSEEAEQLKQASREAAPPGAVEHKWEDGPTVFEHELEEHRKQMEDDSERYTGQHASIEVRRLREAVQFLLAVVHQPGEPKLEEYGRALGADLQALVERVEQLSNSLSIFDRTFNARLNGEAERVKALEGQKLKLRIDGIDKRLQEFQPWRIGESPVGLLKRIERLEENVPDNLKARISSLTDWTSGDPTKALIKRLDALEGKLTPGNKAGWEYRIDTVEKVVILHEKRLDAMSPNPHVAAPSFPRHEVVLPNLFDETLKHTSRPKIVCLCGSTRFMPAFHKAQLDETLKGNIVLTVGNTHESDRELCLQPDTKKMLDELHKKKIDMADEVFVLNAVICKFCERTKTEVDQTQSGTCNSGGRCEFAPYIGESTRGEIAHALLSGKPVRFLNDQLIDETFWKSIQLAEPSGYPRKMIPGDTLTYRAGQ